MRFLTALLVSILGGAAGTAVSAGQPTRSANAEPVSIEPLPAEFVTPGCGCTFYSTQRPTADSKVLRWTRAEKTHAIMKLDGEVRWLKLIQEKRLPTAREHPRKGDRLVLIFRGENYIVDVPASVVRACWGGARGCSATGYGTRLIVRRGTDAPRELQGWGECSC